MWEFNFEFIIKNALQIHLLSKIHEWMTCGVAKFQNANIQQDT